MFNVSKKTLSLVLCLTLIASVVVFCFAGPASAVTTVKYPTYDSVKSLAAEPTVNLTFDGENRYGIPYHRGNGVSYNKEGFVTFVNSGGWAFIGNTGKALQDANNNPIGVGTVDNGSDYAQHVVDNYLYKVYAGKTYNIVVDYKLLEGSVIDSNRKIYVKVDKNPRSPAEVPNAVTSITGDKVVWETDGVLQEGKLITVKDKDKNNVDVNVLTTDTDLQTMTATITSAENGYIALRTHMGDGDNYNATVAIDSIKIYNLTDLGSSVQNPISFDNGGVAISRYIGSVGYATEENGNRYFAFDGTGGNSTGSLYFANAEYGQTILNKDQAANGSADNKMFKFLPGHSYEVTFRFRIAENANNKVTLGSTQLQPRLAKAPAGAAHNNDDLYGANTWAKDIFFSGITVQAIGVWQDAKITFTVKTAEESEAGFEGAYFGFRGAGLATHIDDYNVRELINYSVKTFDARNVSLDFEGTIPTHSASAGTVEYLQDENDNTYMKYTGGGRMSFDGTNVLKAGKKYYISFDAKTDDGCTHFNFVMGNKGQDSASYRIFFNGNDSVKDALKNSGSKFYIDGKEVDGYTNFKPSSDWQHFGFVLNLDSTAWAAANSPADPNNTFNDSAWKYLEKSGGVYFLFGADGKSVCYDNIKISQFDEIKNAVPDEGEIKDNTQVSKRNPSGTGEGYISAGLRFKNCLPNDVVAAADEVGFVVIPSTMAVTAPTTWYKLDGTGHTDAKTVVCKNASINKAYEITPTDTYYQLVLTGLSTEAGKTAYNRRFSAVMYTKTGDAYTYYALGETSYNQVGAIKDVINAQ